MTDNYIGVQLKFSGGVKSPIVTGDRRLTLRNLINLLGGVDNGSVYGGGGVSVMVQSTLVKASATATPVSVQSGDTVTIAGTALTAAQRRATGTATAASVTAGVTLTLNGVVFTAVNGSVTLGDPTFDCSGNDTACATSIAAQVNGYASYLLSGIVAARSAAAVVTFYAVTQGTTGNSITLASSDGGKLAVSGANLANGAAISNNTFDMAGTDITTGAALAYAINNSTTTAIKRTTATAAAADGVVTISAKVAGPAGNAITLTSSDGTRLAVTGSGFLANGSAGEPTTWSF